VITVLSQMKTSLAGLALGALLVAGCQDPDVGQSCALAFGSGDATADYLELGNTECENLVCIATPGAPSNVKHNPYCSKPCVSNSDCSESDTGLVCRSVVVDPNFVRSLTPEQQQKYQEFLGAIEFSNYCAAPLP
jgi:hypothetical protein